MVAKVRSNSGVDMKIQKSTKNYRIAIQSICSILNSMSQELGVDLSLNQLRILAHVMKAEAKNEHIEMRDLYASLSLSRGAVSRHVATLTAKGYGGRAGLGLLVQTADASDRRVRRVSLSERGHEAAAVFGESVHSLILDQKESVIKLIVEKSKSISVMAGVDPGFKVSVYSINGGTYSSSTYQQIVFYSMRWIEHKIHYDEIIDLSEVDDIDLDDAETQAVIHLIKLRPTTRRICFRAENPEIFDRIKLMEGAWTEAGLSNTSVHDNLSDIRARLGLPDDWEYPDMAPLII